MNLNLNKPKPFAWSYSRLKNFRTCPRRHNHIDLLKDVPQPKSPELDEGEAIHLAFQRRVEKGLPMPTKFKNLSDWGDELVKVYHPNQKIYCEQQMALTRDGRPCDWFAKDVWFRIKVDHLKLFPWKLKTAALVIDFKTGVPKDDLVQLALYAWVIFSTYPDVEAVRAEYWWTKVKDKTTEIFTRDDIDQLWEGDLLPELMAMEQAYVTQTFPPKRNGLCKEYCNVTSCEFCGMKQYDDARK